MLFSLILIFVRYFGIEILRDFVRIDLYDKRTILRVYIRDHYLCLVFCGRSIDRPSLLDGFLELFVIPKIKICLSRRPMDSFE